MEIEAPGDQQAGGDLRLGERDRLVLAFAAEHRLILAAQAGVLLGVSTGAAAARLRTLTRAGHLRFERKLIGPGCYLIDRHGLRAIGSDLPRPRDVDLAAYGHDVGLGWLWLAANRGAFGRLDGVVSERRMRSHDARARGSSEPLGVRLPGAGPRGGARRHYPDLLLECGTGHRIAVELELSGKGRVRREAILGGYAADARIDAVLYLVSDRAIGQAIERAAAKVGNSSRVLVQRVELPGARGPAGQRSADRVARRVPERASAAPHLGR